MPPARPICHPVLAISRNKPRERRCPVAVTGDIPVSALTCAGKTAIQQGDGGETVGREHGRQVDEGEPIACGRSGANRSEMRPEGRRIGQRPTAHLIPPVAIPALSISGVSHAFGPRKALDDVTLDVPTGSFTALLGVNGAGKSTLFNLITRLYDNVSGSIEVCGHDVRRNARQALARLGVVFQSRALDGTLTVAQNFAYAGALYGMASSDVQARGRDLLERIGLAERIGDKVRALSGGQARRVEIARALLHGPELLLCDEATVGLDVKSRTDIVAEVHALAADQGVGVLWATHLIDEILPNDRVVVLHQGRVLATGSATEIAGEQSLSDRFLAMTNEGAA